MLPETAVFVGSYACSCIITLSIQQLTLIQLNYIIHIDNYDFA